MQTNTPHADRRSSEIDALRTIAMTAVVAIHCGLFSFGWIGVWLFYTISGYVVTQSMIGRVYSTKKRERLKHFFGRRAIRILPIYYLYVALGISVGFYYGHENNWFTIASLFLFFNNYAMIIEHGDLLYWPVGHLWTISSEMQFYLVYGVTLCLLSRRANVVLLIGTVVLTPIARLVASIYLSNHNWSAESSAFAIYAGPGLHADIFAMGAILAFAGNRWPIALIARILSIISFAAATIFGIVYVFINKYFDDAAGINIFKNIYSGILFGQYREVLLYSVIGLCSTALLSLAISKNKSILWALRSKWIQWIGTISYGAYVYHQFFLTRSIMILNIKWTGKISINSIVVFFLSYPLIVVCAALSFYYIEKPLIAAYLKRTGRRT